MICIYASKVLTVNYRTRKNVLHTSFWKKNSFGQNNTSRYGRLFLGKPFFGRPTVVGSKNLLVFVRSKTEDDGFSFLAFEQKNRPPPPGTHDVRRRARVYERHWILCARAIIIIVSRERVEIHFNPYALFVDISVLSTSGSQLTSSHGPLVKT